MKKTIALALSLTILCSLAGCSCDKTKKDEDKSDAVVQTTEAPKEEEKTIVGTWVVEKTEVYDGPGKDLVEKYIKEYYFIGSEWEFTDTEFRSLLNENNSSTYKVLSDTEIEMIAMLNGKIMKHEYEFDGDTLVLCGMYNGDWAHYGRSNAVYFKRK